MNGCDDRLFLSKSVAWPASSFTVSQFHSFTVLSNQSWQSQSRRMNNLCFAFILGSSSDAGSDCTACPTDCTIKQQLDGESESDAAWPTRIHPPTDATVHVVQPTAYTHGLHPRPTYAHGRRLAANSSVFLRPYYSVDICHWSVTGLSLVCHQTSPSPQLACQWQERLVGLETCNLQPATTIHLAPSFSSRLLLNLFFLSTTNLLGCIAPESPA